MVEENTLNFISYDSSSMEMLLVLILFSDSNVGIFCLNSTAGSLDRLYGNFRNYSLSLVPYGKELSMEIDSEELFPMTKIGT